LAVTAAVNGTTKIEPKAAATPVAKQAPDAMDTQSIYAQNFAKIPELAALGPLFKSSKPVELTESETEYVVRCIKHIFPSHVVFQVTIYL
jgi:coatomer protein complex subunit gamma